MNRLADRFAHAPVTSPKSHHYVPKAYLCRFVGADGFLRVLDRKRGQMRRQKPKEVMRIDSYYKQSWAPSGIDPNILETGLASGIEGEIGAALDRLCSSPGKITGDEAANLAAYLEIQRIRVPRQAAWGTELMRQFILQKIGPDLRSELEANRLRLTMKESARFDFMRAVLGTLHPMFSRMEWTVVEAEAGSAFITTDSPVSFVNEAITPPEEGGLGLAGTIVLFPLSSRHLLFMRHPECGSLKPLQAVPRSDKKAGRGVKLTFGDLFDASKVRGTNWYLGVLSDSLCVAENEAPLREAFGL